jgi:hypothetical protein
MADLKSIFGGDAEPKKAKPSIFNDADKPAAPNVFSTDEKPAVPRVFSDDERPDAPKVFKETEKGRFCRYCKHYVVNPFVQRCALHRKSVEATDTCSRFEVPPVEQKEE